jgi:F-type H+-transporting ATPase subunit b
MTPLAAVVWASARAIVDLDFTVLIQLGLFLLCFLLLRSLVFKPLLRLVDERRAQTLGAREDAKRLDGEADERTKKVSRAVNEAKSQAADERERLRQLAKRREQEIVQAAKDEAARVADAARIKVEAQRAAGEREAQGHVRELAGGIAARLAGRSF